METYFIVSGFDVMGERIFSPVCNYIQSVEFYKLMVKLQVKNLTTTEVRFEKYNHSGSSDNNSNTTPF